MFNQFVFSSSYHTPSTFSSCSPIKRPRNFSSSTHLAGQILQVPSQRIVVSSTNIDIENQRPINLDHSNMSLSVTMNGVQHHHHQHHHQHRPTIFLSPNSSPLKRRDTNCQSATSVGPRVSTPLCTIDKKLYTNQNDREEQSHGDHLALSPISLNKHRHRPRNLTNTFMLTSINENDCDENGRHCLDLDQYHHKLKQSILLPTSSSLPPSLPTSSSLEMGRDSVIVTHSTTFHNNNTLLTPESPPVANESIVDSFDKENGENSHFSSNDDTTTATTSSPLSGLTCSQQVKRGRPKLEMIKSLVDTSSESHSSIRCKLCQRVFPREKSLQAHIRTHTGEKPYACDYPGCYRKFTQSGQLRTHQRLHTGEKPFRCAFESCTNRFTHANRHCSLHPQYGVKRDQKSAVGQHGGCTRVKLLKRPLNDDASNESSLTKCEPHQPGTMSSQSEDLENNVHNDDDSGVVDQNGSRKRKLEDDNDLFNQTDDLNFLVWKKKRAAVQAKQKTSTVLIESNRCETNESCLEDNPNLCQPCDEHDYQHNQESHISTDPAEDGSTSHFTTLGDSSAKYLVSTGGQEEVMDDDQLMGALALMELATQAPIEIGSEIDIISDQLLMSSDHHHQNHHSDPNELLFTSSQGDHLVNHEKYFSSSSSGTSAYISDEDNLF